MHGSGAAAGRRPAANRSLRYSRDAAAFARRRAANDATTRPKPAIASAELPVQTGVPGIVDRERRRKGDA
jgi:hypothetical protein